MLHDNQMALRQLVKGEERDNIAQEIFSYNNNQFNNKRKHENERHDIESTHRLYTNLLERLKEQV